MNKTQFKKRYWSIVVDCLVDLLGISRRSAEERAKDLRRRIESRPGADLFYHAEPLDIALDLADMAIDINRVLPEYDTILERYDWSPTGLPEGSEISSQAQR